MPDPLLPPELEPRDIDRDTLFAVYQIGTMGRFRSTGMFGLRLQGHLIPETTGREWGEQLDAVFVMDRAEAATVAAMLLAVEVPRRLRGEVVAVLTGQLPGVLDSLVRSMTAGDN